MRRAIPFSVLLFLAFAASAERMPYERYEHLAKSEMFGPLPEGFDPTKRPSEAVTSRAAGKKTQELSKEQEKLKSAIHFSMINVTPAGETAVGFTDKSDAKNPINYYLKVGESRNGWTVKEADPVSSSMTIVKGDIEVSLKIGGDSAKGAGTTSAVGAAKDGAGVRGSLGSLRARRSQRREAENARMEAQRQQLQEQQAAFEKRQQEAREEEQARRAEEKAAREQERAEQRKQLLEIQEELKRAREEKENPKEEEKEEGENASDT